MKVDILERSSWGAHLAIMAEIEGKVAPSHTPIKALTIMTIQGNSLMSAAIVERGKSKLDNKKERSFDALGGPTSCG